ncbi:hypothetical protein C8Q69DRAFT_457882 [Paecilomyces variotii]|uniref:Secreted protein n=1 Tax=Byssochlamys spectabilis TaxID=264951 RepID=A0A443I240_BYSSP|nr:hypothetical protein C8Q69DRAFT_457882 [Paecilomyces variotii]RWQ98134.1 hypothetical protein C8Q69DRAFT_457882 [Paecilomyces variotii]
MRRLLRACRMTSLWILLMCSSSICRTGLSKTHWPLLLPKLCTYPRSEPISAFMSAHRRILIAVTAFSSAESDARNSEFQPDPSRERPTDSLLPDQP